MLRWNHFLGSIKFVFFGPVLLDIVFVPLLPLRRKSFLVSCSEVVKVGVLIFIYVRHLHAGVGYLSEVKACGIHSVGISEESLLRWVPSHIFPTSWLPSARH